MKTRVWGFSTLTRLWMVAVMLCVMVWCTAVGQAQVFDVDAKAAFLIDATTGQVLFEKNADEALEPASLVKIMTMLVTMDAVKAGKVSLSDPVRTSRYAASIGGSQVYLAEGETHPLEKMLKAIAISSANDASVAVAEFIAGTEAAFTTLMNDRAAELGMTQSYFANADGLPVGANERPSLTSARDIAKAAQELIRLHPEVLAWTSTVMEPFRDSPEFILYNTNTLIGKYDGLDGLKTGFTNAAGYCLVATAVRGDMRLISVVMGTASQSTRSEQTARLLDWGFNRFVPRVVAQEGRVGSIKLPDAANEHVDVVVKQPVRISVPRGENVDLVTELVAHSGIRAPIAAGDQIGEFVVRLNGNEVQRVPVFAAEDSERANIAVRAWRGIRDFVLGLFNRSS